MASPISCVSATDPFYQTTSAARRITLAALAVEQLAPFGQAFVRLVQALGGMDEPTTFAAMRNALEKSWSFGTTGTIDLKGFVLKLLQSPLSPMVKEAAGAVLACWSKLVVAFTGGGTAETTNGLSVYAPVAADFDIAYVEASNHLRLNFGIWALFLGVYYLQLLGTEGPGHPVIQAIVRMMQDSRTRGVYKPEDGATTR